MNIFDIVGPIMVGPSSSHTAGVVRIGNVVYKILQGKPKDIVIKFHGSFATTYQGHGSDRAAIGGVMGYSTCDERIKDSLEIALAEGINYSFETIDIPSAHPNTIIIEASNNENSVSVLGESIGGGNIMIKKIDNIDVEFTGQYDTLIINHNDTPGSIALVTNILAFQQINIANMKVYRARKGGSAIMIIEADEKIDKSLINAFKCISNILNS